MKISKRMQGLVLAFACSFLVSGIGASLTDLGPWYQALRQPLWKPPDAAFGMIWSLIFSLCALSGWTAWQNARSQAHKLRILVLFAANALLNVYWSWLYFHEHRPDWALSELYALWLSIVLLILGLWRISRSSSLMMLPYLVWVTTAGFLNAATIQLNGPFA